MASLSIDHLELEEGIFLERDSPISISPSIKERQQTVYSTIKWRSLASEYIVTNYKILKGFLQNCYHHRVESLSMVILAFHYFFSSNIQVSNTSALHFLCIFCKNAWRGTEQTAQSRKCLLHKQKDLSFNSAHPHTEPSMVVCAWNPSPGEWWGVSQENPWSSFISQLSWVHELQVQWETLFP